MKKKNVLVIDCDAKVLDGFIDGLSRTTQKEWETIVRISNDRGSRVANIRRYFKYFIVAFELFIRRNEYETIITWQQFYGLFFAMFCRFFRVKKRFTLIIMTVIYKDKKGILHNLYKKLYTYAIQSSYIDKMTCVAAVECKNYSRLFGIPVEKFHSIRWGLRDNSVGYQCSFDKKKYIFSAGRSNRDWDFIVNSIGSSKYNAVIVGAGASFKDKYDNINVLVNIPENEYYSILAKSFCVLISLKDATIGAGQITLIQAMQFGKPVIVTQADGLTSDYIINGENGIIVKKEKKAVLNAIEMLYLDEELYKHLSVNSRKTYEESFSNCRLGCDMGRLVYHDK